VKTKPYKHQLLEFEATRDLPAWAFWWDQGTGKSKVVIDTMDYLFARGRITGMFVLAPGGIDANWIWSEIPTHSDTSGRAAFLWRTSKKGTKRHEAGFDALMRAPGLQVLGMSYDAVMTDAGLKAAKKFFAQHQGQLLMVMDETTAIKSPNAKRTRRVLAMAKHATYRRVLNGTPVEDSPFHAYSQIKALHPNLWKTELGIENSGQFRDYFGKWSTGRGKHGTYPVLDGYRNLDKLKLCMYKAGNRLLKEDVLDLPEKVYSQVYFDLDPKQAKVYRALKRELVAELEDGTQIDGELAVVRLTRFQQITSGYLPSDDGQMVPIFDAKQNPRLKTLWNLLPTIAGQAIIWAKYDMDIDAISEMLSNLPSDDRPTFRTYDGRTSKEDRHQAVQDFQAGKFQLFVAKASAAGRGLTLTAADTVVYYNCTFSMDERRQSEDRAHRIGQTRTVRYIDIVATGTVDEHILSVLRGKRQVSGEILGDDLPNWI
jgi:SNF2 family DNA or RNA helicase